MAKAAIVKKYNLSAQGILVVENGVVGVEIADTGEFVNMTELLTDFRDKTIKLSISYDEDYGITGKKNLSSIAI